MYPNGVVTTERLGTLVKKRFDPRPQQSVPKQPRLQDHLGPSQLKSRSHLYMLKNNELEHIVKAVKVDYLTYKETADLHNVKPKLVSDIINKVKKDPKFISKRIKK